jgi:hypothetical protein
MPRSLGEVVAIEKAARQRANKETGDIHKLGQKDVIFTGLSRTYTPFDDDDTVRLPPEGNQVQERVENLLNRFANALTPALDLAVTKDEANTQARADVVVDNQTILPQVPVSHLLFLEHQLAEVRTFIAALVTRNPAQTWHPNTETGNWEADPVSTARKVRQEMPIVLYPATTEHPAQVKTTTVDQPVGTWTNVDLSGAISESHKRELLARVNKLTDAVKTARERANQTSAPEVHVGEAIFSYLFA